MNQRKRIEKDVGRKTRLGLLLPMPCASLLFSSLLSSSIEHPEISPLLFSVCAEDRKTGEMGDALIARYWCHMCSQMVSPVMEAEIKCPFCESGFVEEMDPGRVDPDTDHLGSDRSLSLWAPILLGMMGGSAPHHRRTTRLLPRRELESEEDDNDHNDAEDDDEEEEDESLLRDDLEALIRRRRRIRRSSAAVLQLLQGLRAGLVSDQNEREREQERVILVNPFNQAIILQGSFDVDQNQNHSQTVPGSLGDYLIGPGLDLLLQHLSDNDPNRQGSPPAKKEAVEAMPTVKVEENLQCSVCLDDFEIGAEAKEMPCKHKFHAGCIMPWLQLHSSCPVCRFEMPAEEGAAAKGDGGNGVENNLANEGDGENGNGRRTWLSVPWPFNGLFSSSRAQGGGGASTPRQTSSSSSVASQNAHHRAADEN